MSVGSNIIDSSFTFLFLFLLICLFDKVQRLKINEDGELRMKGKSTWESFICSDYWQTWQSIFGWILMLLGFV